MSFKNKLESWLPVFLWCGVIFILSSIETIETSKIYWWDFLIKKTAHISEYGILYFLIFRALTGLDFKFENSKLKIVKNPIKLKPKHFIIPFILGFFYSLSDEYHQRFVPGRHAKLMDIGFDFLGMCLAFYFIKANLFSVKKSSPEAS